MRDGAFVRKWQWRTDNEGWTGAFSVESAELTVIDPIVVTRPNKCPKDAGLSWDCRRRKMTKAQNRQQNRRDDGMEGSKEGSEMWDPIASGLCEVTRSTSDVNLTMMEQHEGFRTHGFKCSYSVSQCQGRAVCLLYSTCVVGYSSRFWLPLYKSNANGGSYAKGITMNR